MTFLFDLCDLRGGQAQKRGGVLARAGKHFWVLIFFGSFLYQDKKERKENRAYTSEVLVTWPRSEKVGCNKVD